MIRSKGNSELCFPRTQSPPPPPLPSGKTLTAKKRRILGRLEHSFPEVSVYMTCESKSLGTWLEVDEFS